MAEYPWLGESRDVPKGWRSLADAYGELTLWAEPDNKETEALHKVIMQFAPEDAPKDIVAALRNCMWTTLAHVRRVAVLRNGEVNEQAIQEDGGPPDILLPGWCLGPTRSHNETISLSHGTIGSGSDGVESIEERWSGSYGCPVLVKDTDWIDAKRAEGLLPTPFQNSTVADETSAERAAREILDRGVQIAGPARACGQRLRAEPARS